MESEDRHGDLARAYAYQHACMGLTQGVLNTILEQLPPALRARIFTDEIREQVETAKVLDHLSHLAMENAAGESPPTFRSQNEIRELRESTAFQEWAGLSFKGIVDKAADGKVVDDFLDDL